MILRALTNGSVTSTGTLTCQSGVFGGVAITANGTNDATIAIHRDDASGKQIFEIVTKQPLFCSGPFWMEDTTSLYYSVTGTGAAAQIYEWVT